ncbi:MAG: hypothetical protein PHW46_01810 [Candidatus Omnitrophica bacterium]|nr:hypothetical protein [Candidatus Omnitrophota bacterium]
MRRSGKTFTKYAIKNIKEIHRLSRKRNSVTKAHPEMLLEFVRSHTKEMKELYEKKDKHFNVETGDLIILCLELLIENGAEPDAIMNIGYGRFRKKLKGPKVNAHKEITRK